MRHQFLSFIKENLVAQVLAILLFLFLAFSLVSAVTTISTDVVTDGNLQASTTLLVTGAVFTYGDATFGNAATDLYKFTGQLHSSTTSLFTEGFTTYADSLFGNAATDITKFTGQLHSSSTSLFTSGLTTFGDSLFGDATTDITKFTGQLHSSTTSLFTNGISLFSTLTLQNGETIGNATNDNVFIQATTLSVATTTASTTAGALWVAAPAGTSTTTLQINGNANAAAGSATKGSCIQMWREGVAYRLFLSASTTAADGIFDDAADGVYLKLDAGVCRD